ncbi:RL2 [Papiine alphaherpesvirus 2]|uniref:RL2 n=1 Tax=Cercopithecine herpesvirus 16 TaxID=340907 RepID=Q2QBB8_CHV16|nr:RL2 [Papiine alphaherpesvirus 2]ABA29312.1 RL2 [Papiine alphaherpesvirus 2]
MEPSRGLGAPGRPAAQAAADALRDEDLLLLSRYFFPDSDDDSDVGDDDDDGGRDDPDPDSDDTEPPEAGAAPSTPPPPREVCAVCTERIAEAQLCATFPCLHPFCIPCLKTWLPMRNSCPLCNAVVAYLIVGVKPDGSYSTIPVVNDPRTRAEAEEAVRAGTAVDFIWTPRLPGEAAPATVTLGGRTVRALSPPARMGQPAPAPPRPPAQARPPTTLTQTQAQAQAQARTHARAQAALAQVLAQALAQPQRAAHPPPRARTPPRRAQTQTQAQGQTQTQAQGQTQTQAQGQAQSRAQSQAQSQTQAQGQAQSQTQAQGQAQARKRPASAAGGASGSRGPKRASLPPPPRDAPRPQAPPLAAAAPPPPAPPPPPPPASRAPRGAAAAPPPPPPAAPPPPPAERADGSSLGPRPAEQGPRKCVRKTRHVDADRAPAASGPTRYLPVAGLSSVVALAPYLNKTLTGDCLPVLDTDTGAIGAYVVLVGRDCHLARALADAEPQWARRSRLPEPAPGRVSPPEYPGDPAHGLWMTPVGGLLFDQGTLLGGRSFHSLDSRHPWTPDPAGPPSARDADGP